MSGRSRIRALAPQLLFIGFVVPPLIACSLMDRPVQDPVFHQAEAGRKAFRYEAVGPHPMAAGSLQAIYFPLDSYQLNRAARRTLVRHARWLKQHSQVQIQIEGFCDERGGDDYNYRLGDQRAVRTKAYLQRLGIGANRMTTLSHGKIDGKWGPNRRASFILIYPSKQASR